MQDAMRQSETYKLVCIENESDLLALKDQWNQLVSHAQIDSIFIRHEWFDAAWEWIKTDCQLRVLCVYKDNQLVGICPLVFRVKNHPLATIRTLEFLTIPDTQMCDLISSSDELSTVIKIIVNKLYEMRKKWDIIDLHYLSDKSGTLSILPAELRAKGLPHRSIHTSRNLFVSLEGKWQDFYSKRSRRLKKGNNLVANRLKKTGHFAITRLQNGSDLEGTLKNIVNISSHSWKKETGLSLENVGPNRFIHRLSQLTQEKGWLSIWLLTLNEKPVAMEYQLTYQDKVHALRSDFDEAYKDLSPGSFLNWKLLEQLFACNLKYYFMGPGNNAYKLRWTEDGEPLYQIRGYSSTLRGRSLYLFDHLLRPTFRKLRIFLRKKV